MRGKGSGLTSPLVLNTTRSSSRSVCTRRLLLQNHAYWSSTLEQPHPPLSLDQSVRLIPRIVTSRSHLPLSHLEPIGRSDGLPSTRLFSAYIPALECDQYDSQSVMVAEEVTKGTLYAIERVDRGLYALCQLDSRLHVSSLLEASRENERKSKKRREVGPLSQGNWWDVAAVDAFKNGPKMPSKRILSGASAAPLFSMRLPGSENGANYIGTCRVTTTAQSTDPVEEVSMVSMPPEETKSAGESSAEELFDNMRKQYLHTLYLSKVSTPSLIRVRQVTHEIRLPWPTSRKDQYRGFGGSSKTCRRRP